MKKKKPNEYEQYSVSHHVQEFGISVRTEWNFQVKKQHSSVARSDIQPPGIGVP